MVGYIAMSLESKPRLASSAPLGRRLVADDQRLFFDHEPKPCMGSGVPCPELGGGPLVAVVSWNQQI